MPLSFNLLNV